MRVLFLNGRLSDRGGADRWLLGVLARLARRVETVLAVGRVEPLADARRVGPVVRLKGLERSGLERRSAGVADRLRRLLAEVKPDVIHVNDVVHPAALQVVAETGRAVMTVQDHRSFCPGPGRVLPDLTPCRSPMGAETCADCLPDPAYRTRMLALTARRRAAVARMARVVVLSRYMAGELAQAGVPPERITVVPPFVDGLDADEAPGGVPTHRTASRAAMPVALHPPWHLFAGRLTRHKGADVALEAAGMLREAVPLVVAGEGPLAETARATPGVFTAGWVGRQGMAHLLDGACSLWMPARWAEPFGIVGIEALSRGVPVVAVPVGGVPEWLEDQLSGLFIPPGSPRALARAADRLADPALGRRLGRAGQERVARDFGTGRAVKQLLDIWAEVASDPHGIG